MSDRLIGPQGSSSAITSGTSAHAVLASFRSGGRSVHPRAAAVCLARADGPPAHVAPVSLAGPGVPVCVVSAHRLIAPSCGGAGSDSTDVPCHTSGVRMRRVISPCTESPTLVGDETECLGDVTGQGGQESRECGRGDSLAWCTVMRPPRPGPRIDAPGRRSVLAKELIVPYTLGYCVGTQRRKEENERHRTALKEARCTLRTTATSAPSAAASRPL